MNKTMNFILNNLSKLTFLAIYIIMVLIHLFLEAFIPEVQLEMLITMLPFFLVGILLDFILSRNKILPKSGNILTHLLPAGIFILIGINNLQDALGRQPGSFSNTSKYLFLLFIAAPFFISSYNKDNHKKKMIYAVIGTVPAIGAYLYLTTLTTQLDRNTGMFVYLVCYFMMFYSAAGIRHMPFLSIILGALNAAVLLYLRKFPVTEEAKLYGWDYDIALKNEYLILGTFVICILVSVVPAIQKTRVIDVKD